MPKAGSPLSLFKRSTRCCVALNLKKRSIHRHFIETFDEAKKWTAGSGPLPRPCWNSSLLHAQSPDSSETRTQQTDAKRLLVLVLEGLPVWVRDSSHRHRKKKSPGQGAEHGCKPKPESPGAFVQAFVEPKCSDVKRICIHAHTSP